MFAFFSCAKESIPPPAEAPAPQQEEQTSGDVWQTAAYQESTGDWLTPSQDPYDLTMVQQAYNNLTKGRAVIPRRESLEVTFEGGLRGLQAGLLPEVAKEFEQAEALEANDRLDVRTYPTYYTPISAKEARELSKTRMASAQKLPKQVKHKYIEPEGKSSEGIVPASEIELPLLYVVWPVDKEIPADLDHETLYEVFIPRAELPAVAALNLSEKALQALRFETQELARRADKGLELTAMFAEKPENAGDHPFEIGQQVGGRTLLFHGPLSEWDGDAIRDRRVLVIFEGKLDNGKYWRGYLFHNKYNPRIDQNSGESLYIAFSALFRFPKGDIRVTSISNNLKIPAHWDPNDVIDVPPASTTPPRGNGGARWDTGLVDDDDENDMVFLDPDTIHQDPEPDPHAGTILVHGDVKWKLSDPGLNSTDELVPLAHIQVKITNGSDVIYRTNTDANGNYSTGQTYIPLTAGISLIFHDEDGDFKLTRFDSDSPIITQYMGTVLENLNQSNMTAYTNATNLRPVDESQPVFEAWIAADYYWNGNHPLPVFTKSGGSYNLRIASRRDDRVLGLFTYNSARHTHITIFRRADIPDKTTSAGVIGTVFHELGHWTQWGLKGGTYHAFDDTAGVLRESWADYVGWELGERYLDSRGWSRAAYSCLYKTLYDDFKDPVAKARQNWSRTLSQRDYSPLFIDMADAYNQSMANHPRFPMDRIQISNPYALLRKAATDSKTLLDFKRTINDYYLQVWPGDEQKRQELVDYVVSFEFNYFTKYTINEEGLDTTTGIGVL